MDEDLKLVERLRHRANEHRAFFGSAKDFHMMEEAAEVITRLHAEIEALKSDVSDLVRAGSDEATENERLAQLADERAERMGQIAYERDDIAASFSVATNALSDALFENERLVKERDEWKERALDRGVVGANWMDRAIAAEAQRDAALGGLRDIKAYIEHQGDRATVADIARAASRTLEGE